MVLRTTRERTKFFFSFTFLRHLFFLYSIFFCSFSRFFSLNSSKNFCISFINLLGFFFFFQSFTDWLLYKIEFWLTLRLGFLDPSSLCKPFQRSRPPFDASRMNITLVYIKIMWKEDPRLKRWILCLCICKVIQCSFKYKFPFVLASMAYAL